MDGKSKMSSLLGFIAGVLVLYAPSIVLLKTNAQLFTQELTEQYPDKKWVRYISIGWPVLWILLYLLGIMPFLLRSSGWQLYLVTYLFFGGIALGYGVVEVLSGVSILPARRVIYLPGNFSRRMGWIRIGLVLITGILPVILWSA